MLYWWGLEYAFLVGIRICFIGGDLNMLYTWGLECFIGGDWKTLYWWGLEYALLVGI